MSGLALADAAEALVGVRFRLHGRDPRVGLDCVGLLGAALAAIGRPAALPNGYALRARSVDASLPDPATVDFAETSDEVRPGDVVLLRLGPCQFHLAIAARGGGHVHAHAGLRRVVLSPPPFPGEPVRRWRLKD